MLDEYFNYKENEFVHNELLLEIICFIWISLFYDIVDVCFNTCDEFYIKLISVAYFIWIIA
jgi:hypothetical protein